MNFEKSFKDSKSNIIHLSRYGEGGTFLDIGCNVGFVSEAAIGQFSNIVSVEAHPLTANEAEKRLSGKALVLNAAVMKHGGLTAFVSTPENSIGASARLKKRLKKEDYYEKVTSVSFQSLLDEYRPRVFKMDIEGSEYECLEEFHPNPELEFFQVEYHGTRSSTGWERVKRIEEGLKEIGFERLFPDSISMTEQGFPKSFFFVCCYRREIDGEEK